MQGVSLRLLLDSDYPSNVIWRSEIGILWATVGELACSSLDAVGQRLARDQWRGRFAEVYDDRLLAAGKEIEFTEQKQGAKSGQLFSSSQFCDAKFRPYPAEAVIRYLTVVASRLGRMVFKRFKPINDVDATFRSSDRGAWRLIS